MKTGYNTKSIAKIRSHMKALGHPIDDFTDEDMEQAMCEIAKIAARSGISSAEAYAGLKQARSILDRTPLHIL